MYGSISIHQDVDLYAGLLGKGDDVRLELRPGRHAWVQVVRGSLTLNGESLAEGDGAAVSDEADLQLQASAEAEVLVFDLA